MFRNTLNKLIESGGLWFATMLLHIMSATITTLAYLIIGVIIKWIGKNT